MKIQLLLGIYLVCASLGIAEEKPLEVLKFLISDLSKNPDWIIREPFTSLSLPSKASINELVSEYVKHAKFKFGYLDDYDIEEICTCAIPSKSNRLYKIARISSDQGGKFLIFRWTGDVWRCTNYDVRGEYRKAVAEQDGGGKRDK